MVEKMTIADLAKIPITYDGSKYAPVHHIEVITLVKEYLKEQGFTIEKEEYIASKKGQQLIGKYFLAHEDAAIKPMISFKNSLDGSMSFGICSGTSIFICGNGIVFGNAYQYKRKHMGDAHDEILENTRLAVESLPAVLQFHKDFILKLKRTPVSIMGAAESCGVMFFEGIINTEQLNTIKSQFDNPAHDYGNPNTAWTFYNHCTYALKEAHPSTWHNKHSELSDFFLYHVIETGLNLDEEE